MPTPSATPRVDLHAHTTVSDGRLTPDGLVRAAAAAGVTVLAVTDHDTTEGIAAAGAAARAVGIRVLPGIEISTHVGRTPIHLLGYFPARALPLFVEWQEARRRERVERVLEIIRKLEAFGFPVEVERVLGAEPDPRASPGRPHVARALVEKGYVIDMQDAFDRLLARGQPCYVAAAGPDVRDAVAMLRGAGGLSVVAHPGCDRLDDELEQLVAAGVDGIEVHHPSHDPEAVAAYRRRARAHGLLVTGGSDYHGEPEQRVGAAAPPSRLGQLYLPPEEWERFEDALRARAGGEIYAGGEP